jgi:hypothetical protein
MIPDPTPETIAPRGTSTDGERGDFIVPSPFFCEFAEVVGRLIAERWLEHCAAASEIPMAPATDAAARDAGGA